MEGDFLGFETVTFAPIALDLIDESLLTDFERQWLNDYHAQVREKIGPQLSDDADRKWLEDETRAI